MYSQVVAKREKKVQLASHIFIKLHSHWHKTHKMREKKKKLKINSENQFKLPPLKWSLGKWNRNLSKQQIFRKLSPIMVRETGDKMEPKFLALSNILDQAWTIKRIMMEKYLCRTSEILYRVSFSYHLIQHSVLCKSYSDASQSGKIN